MATKAKATTAKTPRKKVAVSTAASDSPAKKATTSTKLADEKETTAPKAAKSTSTTRRRTAKPTEAKSSAKEAVLKKTTETPSKPVAKVVRAKAAKATETDSENSEKTKSKAKRTPKAASAEAADKTSATKRTRTVKTVKESPKATEKKTVADKKAKTAPAAAKEATTEKTTKSKAKAQKKTATRAKAKVVVKGKASKAKAAAAETAKAPSPEKAKPVEAEVEVVEKEVPAEAGPLTQQEREELARINAELPKSSTQRAFEAAAELAPLVQSHKSNGGTEVNAHEAQKAAEYLMNSMATKTDEHIVVDGITIPTQAELLEMPEEDYMNERQVAFFKWLLKQRESELKSNAGQTTENLRETTIAPDPADRATIEEEHALELRTRDRERKLLKKVQEALRRLENGEFGWCEETGEPIGIPRLLARPTATLSLEAQQRREQRQKLYGD